MNRKDHEDAYTAIALLMGAAYVLYSAVMSSKGANESTKKYQEPKSTSSSISSEYVKEESELEKSLVTSEMTKESELSVSSKALQDSSRTTGSNDETDNKETEASSLNENATSNSEDSSQENELIRYDKIDLSMYFQYIGYVKSKESGNKFYLFDYDSKAGTYTEINGLFTFDFWGAYNFRQACDFLTDEEQQVLWLRTEGSIRTVKTILNDLNKKYANKSDEEILEQVKEDANNNEKYNVLFIELLIKDKDGEKVLVPVLNLGTGIYYEINGNDFWNEKDVYKDRFENLSGYINNGKYGSIGSIGEQNLSVAEINQITALINQDVKQELNSKSRSLTK